MTPRAVAPALAIDPAFFSVPGDAVAPGIVQPYGGQGERAGYVEEGPLEGQRALPTIGDVEDGTLLTTSGPSVPSFLRAIQYSNSPGHNSLPPTF